MGNFYTKQELALIILKDSKMYCEEMSDQEIEKCINVIMRRPNSFFIRRFKAYDYYISVQPNNQFFIK